MVKTGKVRKFLISRGKRNLRHIRHENRGKMGKTGKAIIFCISRGGMNLKKLWTHKTHKIGVRWVRQVRQRNFLIFRGKRNVRHIRLAK